MHYIPSELSNKLCYCKSCSKMITYVRRTCTFTKWMLSCLSLKTGQHSFSAKKKSKNYEILFVCSVMNVVNKHKHNCRFFYDCNVNAFSSYFDWIINLLKYIVEMWIVWRENVKMVNDFFLHYTCYSNSIERNVQNFPPLTT